jgi:DNA primase catalytic core
MISKNTIDNVFSAINAVEIIGQHVELKKSGKSYKGKCPFHNETDSSFTVSLELNIFTCFGCSKSGNAINFLMEYKNINYPQAIKEVASFYNIEFIEDDQSKEDIENNKKRELFFKIYEQAKQFYHDNLFKAENAIALEYALSRFTIDQIQQFQIGFAADHWHDLRDHLLNHTLADNLLLLESKIISFSKERYFDFFRNRLMFPIWNSSNRVISFGGRILPNIQGPKYLNTANSPIYNKSKSLYLINHSMKSIRETSSVTFVEGYTDAITLHGNSITNAVAPSGTALTDEQIRSVKKHANTATLIYDGDSAGIQAANKNAIRLIENGFIVKIINLPDGKDPFDYFNTPGTPNNLDELTEDFLFYKAKAFTKSSNDPLLKHDGIKFLSKLIYSYTEKSLRNFYIDELSKIIKCTKKQFTDEIASLDASSATSKDSDEGLPEGIDISSYEQYGFYAHQNEYFFRNDKGGKVKLSNFIMNPLFHVKSINDTRRIYELINHYGQKIVVDFDMQEMVSISNFRRNIEGRGNFIFYGHEQHMNKLKLKLYKDTRTCHEITNLGWQKEGFFAWSNGVVTPDGLFTSIDENGLVNFNSKDYFIPAFSKIYIDDRSVFLDERKFKYQQRDTTLHQWSELFIKVFGDNARLGIAFWIATIFRDHLLHTFNNFPLLNLFGPKGTGKSQMAMSLSCLFGQQQTPFNIHNGTKPGMAEHIQQFTNAFAWIDEYKNNIEYDKIETLKSIYDAIGRNRLNFEKGKKKETTLVNSAVILSGQEMPTADVALFSRMIFLQFHKSEYSQQEKTDYDLLKALEKEGLSHLTSSLIAHRKYFEENFYSTYTAVFSDMSSELEHSGIEDRILRSFCTILAAFKTIHDKLSISIDYAELRKVAINAIIDQNSQISMSDEMSMFWETIEALFDENILIDRWHFKVDSCSELSLKTGKKGLTPGSIVLKLKFATIYKIYATHSKRSGQSVLPNSTLKYYLEKNLAFLGIENSSKFQFREYSVDQGKFIEQKQVTSAYCFDYKMLDINLVRIAGEEIPPDMFNTHENVSLPYKAVDTTPF